MPPSYVKDELARAMARRARRSATSENQYNIYRAIPRKMPQGPRLEMGRKYSGKRGNDPGIYYFPYGSRKPTRS